MKQLFLFGAGASNGSGPCHPTNPALGKDLIRDLLPHFHPYVHRFIDQRMLSAFEENFEEGMHLFWQQHSAALPQFMRDMGFYFAMFSPEVDNLYVRLIKAIALRKHRVLLSTLNYDMLIESAITINGLRVSWERHEFWEPDKLTLLKLHGSCNFLPELHGGSIRGIGLDVGPPQPGISAMAWHGDSKPVGNMTEVRRFMKEEDTLGPIMAAYHRDKPLFFGDPKLLKRWQKEWAAFLEQADVLFVIGTSLVEHDKHIWEPVANFRGTVEWVSRRYDGAQRWCDNAGVRFNHMAPTFAGFVDAYERRY